MSVTFRIATASDDAPVVVASIAARQVAAFKSYLRAQGEALGMQLIEPEDYITDSFEARICPLGLSAVSKIFGYDPDAIAVLEDAQFRGRRVSVHHAAGAVHFTLRVALTSDVGAELHLASGNAMVLLESLGLRPDSVGELPIDELRRRLDNPAVQRRAAEEGVTPYLRQIEHLLELCSQEGARFEWA